MLAATSVTGDKAIFALQIAVVHFMYNTIGVVVIYSIPHLRELPIKAAEWLAGIAVKRKLFALAYVVGAFFILPVLMIWISSLFTAL